MSTKINDSTVSALLDNAHDQVCTGMWELRSMYTR